MILFAVVLVLWILLTLPAAVLMGKCIARGLEPAPSADAVRLPGQRTAGEDRAAAAAGRAVRTRV